MIRDTSLLPENHMAVYAPASVSWQEWAWLRLQIYQGNGKRATTNVTHCSPSPGLLDTLIEMNTILEDIQKSLDMYLGDQAPYFPPLLLVQ